jgi:broad specificity phosphatase PhoE
MPRIHLIRHARPASGWGDAAGDPDPGLDDLGRAQAEAVRDALMALPAGERPATVVSSPLRRCRETAAPLAAALGVEVEIDPAVGEIPTPASIAPAERGGWLKRAFQSRWDEVEGEVDYDAWRRGVAKALLARGGTAVFSHFVAINGAVTATLGEARVLAFQPDHASVTVLESDGKALTLVVKGREAQTKVI